MNLQGKCDLHEGRLCFVSSRESDGERLAAGGSDQAGGILAVCDASSLQAICNIAFSSPVAALAYFPSGADLLTTLQLIQHLLVLK